MMKPVNKKWGRALCALLMAAVLVCAAAAPVLAEAAGVVSAPLAESTSTPTTPDSGGGPGNPGNGGNNISGATNGPVVTAYTVTDSAGNEYQRIEQGQKCRIIVAVTDPRITDPAQLTTSQGQPLAVNIKVVSTGTFTSPSLGDISTTTITTDNIYGDALYDAALHYSIILNDITYNGGTSNELKLDISYNNGMPLATVTQAISQCGPAASDQENAKQAALVVQSASYGAGQIQAGNSFTLSAVVLTSGGTSGTENVAVSLRLPEQITVASGSSDYFIGNMAPGETRQVDFVLTAGAAVNAGSYNISLDVTGNSAADGAALTTSKSVTVPVVQPDMFEIYNVNIPENMVVGEESYGTVNLVNRGKSTVYNVEAELQGEGFTVDEGARKYIGNINSGTQSSVDFNVTATQGGTLAPTLVVKFWNEQGEEKTLTQELTITADEIVMEDPGMGMVDPGMGMEIPEQSSGIPGWVWIVAGLVAAAVVVLVTVGIVKRKKRQKAAAQLMEDEDEDN